MASLAIQGRSMQGAEGHSWCRRWVRGALLILVLENVPPLAQAQVTENHFTFSSFVGTTRWSDGIGLSTGGLFGVRGGLALGKMVGIEGTYAVTLTEEKMPPHPDVRVKQYGADLVLAWTSRPVLPYVLGGWMRLEFDPGAGETRLHDALEFGGGLRVHISPRMDLLVEARDAVIQDAQQSSGAKMWRHNLQTYAGLRFAIGGKVEAAHPAAVNPAADEPHAQPDPTQMTPPSFSLENGAEEDEARLLLSGSTFLPNIYFETGKATLKAESFGLLDELGRILLAHPQLHAEVAGHTDSQGSLRRNLGLSHQRAQSVATYILRRFPELGPRRILVVGYESRRPVASNETVLGRALNRRVEIVLINHQVIKSP